MQARHYERHPLTWTLPDTLCLPLPARHSGALARDLDYGIIATKDLWRREAWAPAAARAQRATAPPAHVTNNPRFNADESSSSGEESVDLDSRHYPNPQVQPQARDPPENAEAPGRNAAPRTMPCDTPQLGAVDSQPDATPHNSDSPLQPAEVSATDRCTVSDQCAVPVVPDPSQQIDLSVGRDTARQRTVRTRGMLQATPSLPQPLTSSQMWSAVCSAPHSQDHRPMIPNARVHRDEQPRRAHLAQCGPRALMQCPSITAKRNRAMRTRKAKSTRTLKPSGDAPTSPSTPPRRTTSVTQHPQATAQPMTLCHSTNTKHSGQPLHRER